MMSLERDFQGPSRKPRARAGWKRQPSERVRRPSIRRLNYAGVAGLEKERTATSRSAGAVAQSPRMSAMARSSGAAAGSVG